MVQRRFARGLTLSLSLLAIGAARAEPPRFPFPHAPGAEPLARRFAPPPGAARVAVPEGSFGAWLRELPLRPVDSPVILFDGREKPRQDVHAAVVDLPENPTGRPRDLQQCADAVMRLWAEYRVSRGDPVTFHPDRRHALRFQPAGAARARFERWLVRLFADAGTASLADELSRPSPEALLPGDVLIQGGFPGHAVLVLDAADGAEGRLLLLGQSYMPAQSFHVLKNPKGGVWYPARDLRGPEGLATPEWRPFRAVDVRRFR